MMFYCHGDVLFKKVNRLVSLTSTSCKFLENILCMLKHFEQFSVRTKLNHGFRSDYSTETQLLVALQDLSLRKFAYSNI